MLELRPVCENCRKQLPYNSAEAMICTFECTFCHDCVVDILLNVCPNCGGGFEKRPIRTDFYIKKYPAKLEEYYKPVVMDEFIEMRDKFKDIDPSKR